MPDKLVEALWIGSHPAEMADRRTLQSGQDTAVIWRSEAETSDNWQYPLPGDNDGPAETARDLIEQLADATLEDAQGTLEREQATPSPRKTVIEAAERRLQALQDEADAEAGAPTTEAGD